MRGQMSTGAASEYKRLDDEVGSVEQVLTEAVEAALCAEQVTSGETDVSRVLGFIGRFMLQRSEGNPTQAPSWIEELEAKLSAAVNKTAEAETAEPIKYLGKELVSMVEGEEKAQQVQWSYANGLQVVPPAPPPPTPYPQLAQDAVKKAQDKVKPSQRSSMKDLKAHVKKSGQHHSDAIWSYEDWSHSLDLHKILMDSLCRPLKEATFEGSLDVTDLPKEHRSDAELAYVKHLFAPGGGSIEDIKTLRPVRLETESDGWSGSGNHSRVAQATCCQQ